MFDRTTGRSCTGAMVTARQIRAAMFGDAMPGLVVERQARRLSDGDSDELALLDARGIWWVARRASDKVSVWVYVGDEEAEVGFERLVSAARAGGQAWTEAERVLLTAADEGVAGADVALADADEGLTGS